MAASPYPAYVRGVVGPVSAAPPGVFQAAQPLPGGGFALPGLRSWCCRPGKPSATGRFRPHSSS
ncbi:hypothetical protein C3Z09_15560 [Lelliottia aquatilis]|nr:hypothetical protein C3Z09_15560 [Lelliottia aquatilis]